jgi:hypothetical protein
MGETNHRTKGSISEVYKIKKRLWALGNFKWWPERTTRTPNFPQSQSRQTLIIRKPALFFGK